jgi:hypothetical protein
MKRQIVAELHQLENSEQIRILYACESGSRARGFPSANSDFDVRFLYVHPGKAQSWIEVLAPVSEFLDAQMERLSAGRFNIEPAKGPVEPLDVLFRRALDEAWD